jgi:hypothetical protein
VTSSGTTQSAPCRNWNQRFAPPSTATLTEAWGRGKKMGKVKCNFSMKHITH